MTRRPASGAMRQTSRIPEISRFGLSRRRTRLARRILRRFGRSEDGSMIVLTLYLILMMVIMGGIAVDMMRSETYRTRLQATLDRAVLAAADLDVCLDPALNPTLVVNDYMEKNGFDPDEVSVQVTPTLNSCQVEATATLNINTIFMRMVGTDVISTPSSSAAMESREQVEISLVLDISGSMRFNNRMARLRPAATEFVTTVMASAAPETMSINLIPYAGQTNPGPLMFDYLNAVRYPTPMIPDWTTPDDDDEIPYPSNSSCIEVPPTNFNANLPMSGLDQTPMFMNWNIAASVMEWGWCPKDETGIIYASDNITTLSNAIRDMPMHDGTGTHYAMRWAVSLLNPSAQPAMQYLADAGAVPAYFGANRPRAFNSADGLKFIVLMTDGQITEQVRPRDVNHDENPYRELSRRNRTQRENITSASQNVRSFYEMCDAAKDNGIIIFTIAFEAPGNAETQMANCATSPAHFYNVDGLTIATAFRAIAGQINQLRLTR